MDKTSPGWAEGDRPMKKLIAISILALIACAPHSWGDTHYVSSTGSGTPPYTSWATAAHTIQDAVNAASAGEAVIVASGVYATGGAATPGYSCMNRVVITSNIIVQSVAGPDHTFIVGAKATVASDSSGNGLNAVRGVYMSAGTLSGFTVTNGHTRASDASDYDRSGGGVNMVGGSGVVRNCVLAGNSAADNGGGNSRGTLYNCTLSGNSADSGGGSHASTLHNCLLTGNSADNGGGSIACTLYNCTLTGNSAVDDGGGNQGGTLNNCIIYYNSSEYGWPNSNGGTHSYCCTTPFHVGTGNMTNAPLFVNTNAANYRLESTSPCIDAGNNADVSTATDLEGKPRIHNGTVDMGAYEWVPPNPIDYQRTETIDNDTWNLLSDDLYVGSITHGNAMIVINGGLVQNDRGFIGYESSADNNTVTVDGSIWNNANILLVGRYGSGNALSITNGGIVQNTWGTLGVNSGADNNTVTVDGSGSVWSNSNFLAVGEDSSGNSLSITNGGHVQSLAGTIGEGSSASDNAATVSGTGSVWESSAGIAVGRYGSGNALTIMDGGFVESGGGSIGEWADADNNAVVVRDQPGGTASYWSNSGPLFVGHTGSGNSLSIMGGALVVNTDGTVGGTAGASGNFVYVVGNRALWRNTGNLYIGGGSGGAGGTGNLALAVDTGEIRGSSVTVYPSNTIGFASGGSLQVNSVFEMKADTTLQLGIHDDSNAGYGRVVVGGAAWLDGTLDIVDDELEPASGMVFDLFDWGVNVYNSFAEVNLPSLPLGLAWNTEDLYTTGEITIGISTSDTDTDGDGMPDGWELDHFGNPTNGVATDNPDLDPHNNIKEYIAGSDPNSSNSYFRITNAAPVAAGFMIEWAPCISNRWYGVNWVNELTNGFTPIAPGIEFPQNSYTDAVYGADDAGFYQIEVQLK
jgi:T5SS/PEP-CTERM-associated repeat protein